MKIRCQKQIFLKALQSINAVATPRDLYPVLENVRITATKDQLLLRATDLKISLTYFFTKDQVEILESGELLIPALRLQNLVKETPDNDIVLEQDGLNGILTSQNSRFCILGEELDKFPEIPEFQEQPLLEIGAEDFQKLIKKTLFATTAEKTRYDLDNVLVCLQEQGIRFVATDGKRLALCDRKCQLLGQAANPKFTVPSKGLQQIEKVISATTPDKVLLSLVNNQLLFRTSDILLSTRLSEAKFPPYERVVPKNLPFSITFAVKDFSSALRRVCILTDEKNKIVEISFTATMAKFFSMGETTGEASVEIPVAFSGIPFTIKFNANFLLEMVKVVENTEIEMWLQDGQSPVLIKDGTDFQYVVLPIKIEEAG